MDNLSFGNIAIGTVIVGVLNLIIVLLVRTETILKYVERIKGVIGLAYKDRAKRSDDEVRLYKKHSQVARERIRHSFVTIIMWDCKWVWNWDNNFQPINIKGYCTGDLAGGKEFYCEHPVETYYFPTEEEKEKNTLSDFVRLAIECSNTLDAYPHAKIRASFNVPTVLHNTVNSHEAFIPIITKAIIAERDLRIAKEIKNIRLLFWR